jgi:hypothetical protein
MLYTQSIPRTRSFRAFRIVWLVAIFWFEFAYGSPLGFLAVVLTMTRE